MKKRLAEAERLGFRDVSCPAQRSARARGPVKSRRAAQFGQRPFRFGRAARFE